MSRDCGLIETMLVTRGRVPLWARHRARWQRSCEALGIEASAPDGVPDRVRELVPAGVAIARWVTEASGEFAFSCRPFAVFERAVRLHAVTVEDPGVGDP
ncbi:MAG: hypothetical protein KDB80_11315, partial [Planctomycetes bacterium]|nr:hypothetical protein [Planctomycetota bacterium]